MVNEVMRGFRTLEEAEAFIKTIKGKWDIVELTDGSQIFNSLVGQPIAYFIKEAK